MDKDKRMTIERWMTKAFRDLQTAKTMIRVNVELTDIVCFHCQQCAEKSLKAFLVFMDYDFPRTHDLPELLEMCAKHGTNFSALMEDARFLTEYAVETRYPGDWFDIPAEEAAEALERAETIMKFVQAELKQIDGYE